MHRQFGDDCLRAGRDRDMRVIPKQIDAILNHGDLGVERLGFRIRVGPVLPRPVIPVNRRHKIIGVGTWIGDQSDGRMRLH